MNIYKMRTQLTCMFPAIILLISATNIIPRPAEVILDLMKRIFIIPKHLEIIVDEKITCDLEFVKQFLITKLEETFEIQATVAKKSKTRFNAILLRHSLLTDSLGDIV